MLIAEELVLLALRPDGKQARGAAARSVPQAAVAAVIASWSVASAGA